MNLYLGVSVFFLILVQVVLPTKAQSCEDPPHTLKHTWFDTRLVGGERDFEGRVEVFLDNSWRSLCDQGWDRVKADLVCEGLGYGYAVSVVTGSRFGPGTGEIYRGLHRCYGYEKNIGCCNLWYVIRKDQCSNSTEAGVVCSGSNVTQGSLRFSDSDSNPYQGRLEMYNGSQWGTICHSGWTESDARVACSQMGLPGVAQTLFYTSGGGSSQPIWFSDVQCSGNESSLLECSVNRDHSCTHATDVGVKCSLSADTVPATPMNISLRLAGGRTDYQGRVEVYRDNQWKLVCGSDWDQSEGDVVCRQLGLGYAVATTNENTITSFFKGSGSVWSVSISCVGSERTLGECSVTQPATSSCALNNSVSVFCSGRNLASGSIRFVSSYFIDSVGGRLEVFLNNEWGTICNSGWDGNDARVACKELGFVSLDRESGTQGGGYRGQKIWMKNVNCQGTESQLVDCNYASGEDCDHWNDIAISCFNTVLHSLRLVGGRNRSEGYVQIFGQSWTTICNDDFDMIDAAVTCRELGYNYATAVVNDGRFSRDELGSSFKFTVTFDCSGNEQRLYDCPRRYSTGCRTENDLVGVVCSQTMRHSVRLVGGKNKSEGYVQVFGNFSWTSICNDEFDMADAAVTCRELGYNYASAVVNDGRFSKDELGMEQFDNLAFDCSGNEQRLWECPRIYSPGCILGRDLVGVVCSQTSGGTIGPPVTGAPSDNAAVLLGAIVGGVVGGVFLFMLVVVIVVILITVAVCLCTRGRKSTHHYRRVQMINM